MTEIVLKVDPGAGYVDGDIIEAFTDRQILHVHSEHLGDTRKFSFNGHGLNNITDLSKKIKDVYFEYRFERVNKTQVKRINLTTLEEEIFGEPDIYVEQYIKYHTNSLGLRHQIFGTRDNEIWYGGGQDFSDTNVNAVWNHIETDTVNVRTDEEFTIYPIGVQDSKSHLLIPTTTFTDADAADLILPKTSGNGDLLNKRKHHLTWQTMDEFIGNKTDIQNKNISVDYRKNSTKLLPILDYTLHKKTK